MLVGEKAETLYLGLLLDSGRDIDLCHRNKGILLNPVYCDILAIIIAVWLILAKSPTCIVKGNLVTVDTFFLQGCSDSALVHSRYLVLDIVRCSGRQYDIRRLIGSIPYHNKLFPLGAGQLGNLPGDTIIQRHFNLFCRFPTHGSIVNLLSLGQLINCLNRHVEIPLDTMQRTAVFP